MKRLLCLAAIACMSLFISCEKQGVPHTGDLTGNLYGIWALTTKSETYPNNDGPQASYDEDYTAYHFYLVLSEFPFPHALAKKGSLDAFDLDDVDVDAVRFTYNSDSHQISFKKTLWLSDELLTRNMILSGTFDVTELSETTLTIQQHEKLTGKTVGYTYTRQKNNR